MEELQVIKQDEVFYKINASLGQSEELFEYFAIYAKDFKYHPLFKKHIWNGKLHFYNKNDSTLPIGLYSQLVEFCSKFNYDLKLISNDKLDDISDEVFTGMYKEIFNEKYYPRDYQDICIKKAIRYKRGLIESVTGSGKSMVIYSMIRFLLSNYKNKKVLLIVPNISLVNQMFSDFKDYGYKEAEKYVSLLFGKSKSYDENKPILVSTWQSLYKKPANFFKPFIGVIVDETHLAKGKCLQNTLKKCMWSEYRIGLTGTLPEDKSELYTIYGYLGQKLHSVGYSELIDRGVLSKIQIVNMILKYPEEFSNIHRGRPYAEEVSAITTYPDRNKVFSYIISHLKKSDNFLLLCSEINHLKQIKEYLETTFTDRKVYEIYGKINPTIREDIRKRMNDESGVILIGTYKTMSTGINIKKIHHIMFASSYKSKIKILQSIGRGLRTHESKSRLVLWDIVDDLCRVKRTGSLEKNYVYKHFEERYRYYTEVGFESVNKVVKIGDLQ